MVAISRIGYPTASAKNGRAFWQVVIDAFPRVSAE
jgi:hypothetical protein